ncbi:MAG: hypothetical protein O2805_06430, partial [Proteobacteria bacterium]|nr:hypothetical protein [Pseudomonadota bacterium]
MQASDFILATLLGSALLLAVPASADDELETRLDCAFADDDPLRRRPGKPALTGLECDGTGLQPAVWRPMPEFAAVPDRWRIVTALGYPERELDPYHGNNVLKGDRPLFGEDWFFSLGVISDSTFETRSVPTPVASATPPSTGAIDVPGEPAQNAFTQNLVVETVLYKGDTV